MRFPRCRAHAGDRGNDRTVCSEMAATTRRRFGVGCGRDTLCRGSLCVVPRTGVGWAGGGGWSSGRLHGSTSSDARPLRQAGRHPRRVPLARVRADLLAVAAQDVETRLRPMPSFPGVRRPNRRVLPKSRPTAWGPREARPWTSVNTTPLPRIDRVRAPLTAILPAVWPSLQARISAFTKSPPRLVPAAWVRSIARPTAT